MCFLPFQIGTYVMDGEDSSKVLIWYVTARLMSELSKVCTDSTSARFRVATHSPKGTSESYTGLLIGNSVFPEGTSTTALHHIYCYSHQTQAAHQIE